MTKIPKRFNCVVWPASRDTQVLNYRFSAKEIDVDHRSKMRWKRCNGARLSCENTANDTHGKIKLAPALPLQILNHRMMISECGTLAKSSDVSLANMDGTFMPLSQDH